MQTVYALIAGLLMGFASSLHCAAMCGGISSTLLFLSAPQSRGLERLGSLLMLQSGRVTAYCALGAVLGATGSGFETMMGQAMAYRVLQWASAMTLFWIGLSIAGILPPMVVFDRYASMIGGRVASMSGVGAGLTTGGRFVSGMVWGFMPCAMVYGALFSALLTGSGGAGGAMMLGFGLGTIPSVILAAMGIASLRDLSNQQMLKMVIGFLIVCVGALTLVLEPKITAFCLS